MRTNKNEINNNIIKLLTTVVSSVVLPKRRLPYLEFQPLYTFTQFFSSNHSLLSPVT